MLFTYPHKVAINHDGKTVGIYQQSFVMFMRSDKNFRLMVVIEYQEIYRGGFIMIEILRGLFCYAMCANA